MEHGFNGKVTVNNELERKVLHGVCLNGLRKGARTVVNVRLSSGFVVQRVPNLTRQAGKN
jgi:hypothetical protein